MTDKPETDAVHEVEQTSPPPAGLGRCKGCAHWQFSGAEYGRERDLCAPLDPDTYEPMAMPFEVKACKHPALTFCERPVEVDGFGVADGSEFMAILVTGPDFGCVRWQALAVPVPPPAAPDGVPSTLDRINPEE